MGVHVIALIFCLIPGITALLDKRLFVQPLGRRRLGNGLPWRFRDTSSHQTFNPAHHGSAACGIIDLQKVRKVFSIDNDKQRRLLQ